MLDGDSRDGLVVGIPQGRPQWQQHFLLHPEVVAAVLPPEAEEHLNGIVDLLGPPQALSHEERLVVVAGEGA